MKTKFLIITFALALFNAVAQNNTAGELHQLAAPLPTTAMANVTTYADGSSITNPPQFYLFWASSNSTMIPAIMIGVPVSVANPTANFILSAPFVVPWSTKVYFSASSSNSVVGNSAMLVPPISITAKSAPIVFTQPLSPPSTLWTNF